jgi:hypothetical protein
MNLQRQFKKTEVFFYLLPVERGPAIDTDPTGDKLLQGEALQNIF